MREAIILTIRVEVPDHQALPETWPEAKAIISTSDDGRVELLETRED